MSQMFPVVDNIGKSYLALDVSLSMTVGSLSQLNYGIYFTNIKGGHHA